MKNVLLIVKGFKSCFAKRSTDIVQQEISDFFDNKNNHNIINKAYKIEKEWDTLTSGHKKYTRSKLIQKMGLLEQRASASCKDLNEIVPPRCLGSFWNKEVEASKLFFQAISLTYSHMDDPNAIREQTIQYICKANELKDEAQEELEDIYDEHHMKYTW